METALMSGTPVPIYVRKRSSSTASAKFFRTSSKKVKHQNKSKQDKRSSTESDVPATKSRPSSVEEVGNAPPPQQLDLKEIAKESVGVKESVAAKSPVPAPVLASTASTTTESTSTSTITPKLSISRPIISGLPSPPESPPPTRKLPDLPIATNNWSLAGHNKHQTRTSSKQRDPSVSHGLSDSDASANWSLSKESHITTTTNKVPDAKPRGRAKLVKNNPLQNAKAASKSPAGHSVLPPSPVATDPVQAPLRPVRISSPITVWQSPELRSPPRSPPPTSPPLPSRSPPPSRPIPTVAVPSPPPPPPPPRRSSIIREPIRPIPESPPLTPVATAAPPSFAFTPLPPSIPERHISHTPAPPRRSVSRPRSIGPVTDEAGLLSWPDAGNMNQYIQSNGSNQVNPNATYQHIQDMAAKRVSTLDYLRKTHEGRVYWFNTLLFSRSDINRLPSFESKKLARRAANLLMLGLSIPNILEMTTLGPVDFLRALNTLLVEFEAYQQVHPTDGSISSSLSRARIPHIFKRTTNTKTRRTSSAADIGLPFGNNDLSDNKSFLGSITSASTTSTMALATSDDLLPGEEYSYLITPSLPFDPDFFEVFASLCDVLIDCYVRITNLVSGPEKCVPGLAEIFTKTDSRLRKVMVAGIVKEFEDATRAGVKGEVAGIGKVVLGGLM